MCAKVGCWMYSRMMKINTVMFMLPNTRQQTGLHTDPTNSMFVVWLDRKHRMYFEDLMLGVILVIDRFPIQFNSILIPTPIPFNIWFDWIHFCIQFFERLSFFSFFLNLSVNAIHYLRILLTWYITKMWIYVIIFVKLSHIKIHKQNLLCGYQLWIYIFNCVSYEEFFL